MKHLRVGMLLLLGLFLNACATTDAIFAGRDEPHGIVDLDIAKQASDQYQAFFLMVDGVNISTGRSQLMLRPGVHEIRIGAVIDQNAMTLSVPGNEGSQNPTVTIDVKEGMRYSVAAKLEGTRSSDWRAIVSLETPISGYNKKP